MQRCSLHAVHSPKEILLAKFCLLNTFWASFGKLNCVSPKTNNVFIRKQGTLLLHTHSHMAKKTRSNALEKFEPLMLFILLEMCLHVCVFRCEWRLLFLTSWKCKWMRITSNICSGITQFQWIRHTKYCHVKPQNIYMCLFITVCWPQKHSFCIHTSRVCGKLCVALITNTVCSSGLYRVFSDWDWDEDCHCANMDECECVRACMCRKADVCWMECWKFHLKQNFGKHVI